MVEDKSQAGHRVTDSFDYAPDSFKRWFVLKLLDSILRGHHFPDKLHRRGYEDPQTQDGDAKHSRVLETLTTTSRNQRGGSAEIRRKWKIIRESAIHESMIKETIRQNQTVDE